VQLTRVFLKRPTLVLVLITLTILAAVMALRTLVVQEQPSNGLPAVSVNVAYSGASTTDLQTEVAQPIEDQLAGTPYLDHIDTTIESGNVQITATFTTQSTDTENIANVERALQQAERELPSTITPPTMRVADPSEPVVVTLALTSKKYSSSALAAMANYSIVPVMEQIAGVSNVNVAGTTQPAFMVMVDPAVLAADNLTISDVVNSISPNNIRAPGGIVYQPGRETQLDVRGDLPDPQAVADLPIHVAYTPSSTGGSTSTTSGAPSSTTGGPSTGSSAANAGTAGSNSSAPPATAAGNAASSAMPAMPTMPPLPNLSGLAASPQPSPTGGYGTAGGSSAASATANAPSTTANAPSTTANAPSTTANAASTTSNAPATVTTGAAGLGQSATAAASGMGGYATSAGTQVAAVPATTNVTSLQGAQSLPVDQPIQPQVLNSNGALTSNAASSEAVQPSASSSAFGSGSGTSTSPFVGSLEPWSVPSADKRISDVARVLDSTVVQRIFTSDNGQPGVALFVQKEAQASEVTVSNDVVKMLPALERQFPDVHFAVAHLQSTYTEQQVQGVEHTLIEAIVLTAVVMLFFLGSWRNAIVVMIAIPTSLGVTLFVMKMLNLTLDTVSLMAMTLVIGILVDDSTVVLENIERHRSLGEEPADAALNGRSEIGMAAIVITMVDVVVFLPIAFVSGQVGQYLNEFAIVITVATLTSLFVSFTITPTLAGIWSLYSTWKPWRAVVWFDERFDRLRHTYTKVWLPAALERPWPIVIGAAVACALAILLIPTGLIGEEFIPAGDQGVIYTQVTLPPGHPLSETSQLMSRLERVVKSVVTPHDLEYETTIAGAFSAAFGGFVQEGNAGQISIFLNQDRKTSTDSYVSTLQQKLSRAAPDALISVTAARQQGGGNQQQIDEEVSTANHSDPTPYAAKIYQVMLHTKGATGVQNSAANAAPQEEIEFNRPALQALDVSTGTAADAVQAAFGGYVASQIETNTAGLTDIEVIYDRSDQTSLADVMNVPVRSESGGIVRLSDVASMKYQPAPLIVTRENRAQVIHVTSNVASGATLSGVTNAFLKGVRNLHLPQFVTVRPAAQGQQDLMHQAMMTLGGTLVVSIVLVFLMIVALYDSVRTPFVTLFAIPLATIGSLGALWITRQTLNLFSLIGIVLLVGLVTKNGILLVDYADTVRLRGKSKDEGIREAAVTRFRPIVMTTIAMVAGMLPLAMGLEPGGQTRASLAIVVIGGLLSSLGLTLFIVPIMYRWIAPEKMREEIKFADERRRHRGTVPGKSAPAPSSSTK